jgi:ABC-2 type transport system permease protein
LSWLRIARHAFKVGKWEFSRIWGWQSWLFGSIVGAVAQVSFFALLGNLLDSQERLEYLLIGTAVIAGCAKANVVIAVSNWDRGDGTYPLLVIAPSSLVPAIIGRTTIWMLDGAFTAFITLLLAAVIFDVPMPWPESLVLMPLVLAACASSYFLATAIGSIVTRIPRTRNIVHRFETLALTLFCGATVPVSFWPESIELLANVLPITHGLEAIRDLLADGLSRKIAVGLGLEVVVGLAWLLVGVLIIDRTANGGRRDGSIELIT